MTIGRTGATRASAWIMAAAALTALGMPALAQVGPGLEPQRLAHGLEDALLAAQPDEQVQVIVALRAQADRNEIARLSLIRDKAQRRAAVVEALRAVAEPSQVRVLAMLEAGRQQGTVGPVIRPMWLTNAVGASATPAMIRELANLPEVEYIAYDRPLGEEVFPAIRGEVIDPNEGGVASLACGVSQIGADRVWDELGFTGEGVVVGVIDTGTCLTHPDIVNQVWVNPGEIPGNRVDDDGNGFVDDMNGWNFENNNNIVSDNNGHGSHVAGTVAGDGAQGTQTGVAPDASIMTIKFWNNFGGQQSVWSGMEYGVVTGADVLTASLGWPYQFSPDRRRWREVCENAIAAGVVVFYAAGNEGCGNAPNNLRCPGDVPDVSSIGATTCGDQQAWFTSCGPVTWQSIAPWFDHPYPPGLIKPTVAAPGDNIPSLRTCGGYINFSGTSMATPHVAGLAALMLQANPNLDHFQVQQILNETAIDLGTQGNDNIYGRGRVDAFAAVQMAIDMGGDCPADLNEDGNVDGADFLLFLDLFFFRDPRADLDDSGRIDGNDFLLFLGAFFEGC